MAALLLAFVWSLIANAATYVAVRLFADRPRGPAAGGLGDFVIPTADESRVIPVVCGTVYLKGLNVVWYGDLGVANVESGGATVGYKYYMALQGTLCHGLLDDVTEIRFDDRSIQITGVDVTSANNRIVFGDTLSGHLNADIPVGNYLTYGSLCQAAQARMNTVFGSGTFQLRHGFEIQPGQTTLIYAVKVSGVATNHAVDVPPGFYASGSVLADRIAAALNASEEGLPGGARVGFIVTYDGTKFSIQCTSFGGILEGWFLRGIVTYDQSLLASIGFQMGADFFSATFPSTFTADFPTGANRFCFSRPGHAGKIFNSDAGFSAKSLLGITSTTDQLIESYMAEQDRPPVSGIGKIDAGDFWYFQIIQPELFGGVFRDGGIFGGFKVYKGGLTQAPDAYLESVLGDLPGYRGVSYLVMDGGTYVGTSTQLKNISLVVCRWPNQLGVTGGKHKIGNDSNPACFLYEILTNDRWGAGIPAGSIDTASFLAAADTLFTEGLGVSFTFDRAVTMDEMRAEVERHIDGLVYDDPLTGKMKLKLARADYVPGDLPLITIDNAGEIKITRPSWGTTKNVVKIRYVDSASRFTERIVTAQERAHIATRGITEPEQFDLMGFSNPVTAQLAASRVLKAISYPLATVNLPANRVAYLLRPVDVFRLTVAPLGISEMVCRVTQVRPGELGNGQIVIDAVEDVFGVNWTAFSPPPPSSWADPILSSSGFGRNFGSSWGL